MRGKAIIETDEKARKLVRNTIHKQADMIMRADLIAEKKMKY